MTAIIFSFNYSAFEGIGGYIKLIIDLIKSVLFG